MNNIEIKWNSELQLDQEHLTCLLKTFGDILPVPLSHRLDLEKYSAKLLAHADIACAFDHQEVVGFLALYANDQTTQTAYLIILSILPMYQGKGIGKVMISRAFSLARQRRMKYMNVNVQSGNVIAQRLYSYWGFHFREQKGQRWTMSCHISQLDHQIEPTPLRTNFRYFPILGLPYIDLKIKQDDLYFLSGGGSKSRKIQYIMNKIVEKKHDVIVTNGGPQSNHARASALMAASLGIKCHLVIVLEPGIKYPVSGNLLLMHLSGASIEYCSKNQLSERMDKAIKSYQKCGHNPAYIWGGGHCYMGTVAFVEAAAEAQAQCGDWIPDFLVLASGTGTTQAGLAIGYANLPTRVIGISVARDAKRGTQVILDSIQEYYQKLKLPSHNINVDFRDDWTCGGYEKTNSELLSIVKQAAKSGLIVDPTYSGKALYGLTDLVKSGEIPMGSKVLFWHTGGLMNIMASSLADGFVSL